MHRVLWIVGCLGLWITGPALVLAQPQPNCEALYQKKQYRKAAQCFLKQASQMPPTPQLSRIQRYLKGQTLRNAALAYQKAAEQEQNVEVATYRREQAINTLRQYLKENLCQKKYLCRQARGSIQELIGQIQYTPLSVVTAPGKRAVVTITGYRFKIQHISPPQWNQPVRPGRYTIQVQYEGGKTVRKSIIVSPGQSRTVTALDAPVLARKRPTPPKAGAASPVPWIVLGLGLALAGGGAGLLGYGVSQVGTRDTIAAEIAQEASNQTASQRLTLAASDATQQRIQDMEGAHQTAATTLPIGWALIGVGGASVVTGVILFFVMRPQTTPPAQTALPNARPLVTLGSY